MRFFNWSIVGKGTVSHLFAEGLKSASGAVLYGIASRSPKKAKTFAEEFNIPVYYDNYRKLASDPSVNIAYIGTPNSFHYEISLLFLEKKKAVLCEKPFAMNYKQASEMIKTARKNNCFIMEALWSRFLPSILKLQELVKNRIVGEPVGIKADFGFYTPYNVESRLFNRSLGGGSLLDIGIYPVFLSLLLFGYPDSYSAHAIKTPCGTDLSTGIFFSWKSGKFAQLLSSFAVDLDSEAVIYCTRGKITLHSKFHMPTEISVTPPDGPMKKIPLTWRGNGYNYEAEEVMRCISHNKIESSFLPHDFSLKLMKLLESLLERIENSEPLLQPNLQYIKD